MSLFAGWRTLQPQAAPPVAVSQAQPPASVINPYGPMVVGLGPWARTAETAAAPTPAQQQLAAIASGDLRQSIDDANPQVDAPLPPRRPVELKNLASRAAEPAPVRQAALPATPPPAPEDNRSVFERFFGGAEPSQAPQPAPAGRNARRQPGEPAPTQALAYAAQESTGGLFGGLTSAVTPSAPTQSTAVGPAPRVGSGTAVYDISAHTVYMPDGTKLEAHSGLGEHLDNPRFVHVRMKGPTPPSVYELSPREALFHGVEALRLTPVGNQELYGRAGLLAHTYMLGPNGDSNGCVSFRDYNAFLQAFKRGYVRRLVVVARM